MKKLSLKFVAVIALTMVWGCTQFSNVPGITDKSGLVAKVGIIASPEVEWERSAKTLQHALDFYKHQRVDAVVIIGNLTRNGYMNQYRELLRMWNRTFDKRVKLYAILGENDETNFKPEYGEGYLEVGSISGSQGRTFEVNGFSFYASYSKHYSEGLKPLSFYGKGKFALTDELCFYPRSALAINAGSMHGINLPRTYLSEAKTSNSAQGLLMRVYNDKVTIDRFDFNNEAPQDKYLAADFKRAGAVYAEAVAPAWELVRKGSDWGAADLEKVAPQFRAGTRLQVIKGYYKEGALYTLKFPPVKAKYTGERAFAYDVNAGNGLTKRVLSQAFHQSEDRETQQIVCCFTEAELKGQSPDFSVTPVSSLGVKGQAIKP